MLGLLNYKRKINSNENQNFMYWPKFKTHFDDDAILFDEHRCQIPG